MAGMKVDCVLLAISAGGVTVAREYLADVDEVEFDVRHKLFRASHPGKYIVFLGERELESHLDGIRKLRNPFTAG